MRKLITTIVTLLSAMALAAGLSLSFKTQVPEENRFEAATVLPTARIVQPFMLTDDQNHPFTQENLKGHWTWLYFGFTRCRSMCPTAMAVMNQVYQTLEKQHVTPLPQVVFVSVDPERDTSSSLRSFVHGFNPHFMGVMGDKIVLDQLAKEMSVLYMKVEKPGKGPSDYLIDHSGTLMLLNPQGKLLAFFTAPQKVDFLVKDYQTITKEQL